MFVLGIPESLFNEAYLAFVRESLPTNFVTHNFHFDCIFDFLYASELLESLS